MALSARVAHAAADFASLIYLIARLDGLLGLNSSDIHHSTVASFIFLFQGCVGSFSLKFLSVLGSGQITSGGH